MFKRLMIGLVAVGVVVIFIAEAANATPSRRRRSVGVSFEFPSNTDLTGHYYATGVYGLEAKDCEADSTRCGEIRGTLYCAEADNYAAKSACYAESGVDRALVAVLDPNAIPDFFTPEDHNFPYKAQGQRLELYYFDQNGPPGDTNHVIDIPAAKKRNRAGWHFIADPGFDLESYRGTWDGGLGNFIPADGYGINGEQNLEGVPLVSKYGADLASIDGKVICAVWHHDQVKWQGDSLKGNYYGLGAFFASYDEVSNTVTARLMDAKEVCGGQLYNDVNAGVAESDDSYQCQTTEDVVFAPAPYYTSGGITLEVDAFPEVVETITCDPVGDGYNCWGVAEINLDPVTGQDLCEKHFKDDYPDISFVDFFPINNECDEAFYGYVEYYGTCNPENPICTPTTLLEVTDKVYCSEEFVAGGGSDKFLLYDCSDTTADPADCVGLGQSPWAVGEALTCP